MKAFLILADAASAHPDGTFSLLRGGITQLNVERGKPAVLKAALVVRFTAARGEAGPHEFKVSCVTADGVGIIPEATGSFEVPKEGVSGQMVLAMQIILPSTGRYEFAVSIDKHQMDTWTLDAVEQSSNPKK